MNATSPDHASTVGADHLCGICDRPVRRLSLNGVPVCRKCWAAFINRRQLAFAVDWLLYFLVSCVVTPLMMSWVNRLPFARSLPNINWTIWSLLRVFLVVKDCVGGVSVGKWLCGLQVLDTKTYEPASALACIKRNLILFIPYAGVLIIESGSHRGRHRGDRWADTVVTWRKHATKPPFQPQGTQCLNCHYELTGNVSGICPECGTPVPSVIRETGAEQPVHL